MKCLLLLAFFAISIAQKPEEKAMLGVDNVNNCCIVHDECYNKQGGLKECNKQFYECIDNATVPYCIGTGKVFKLAVASFGRIAYGKKSMQKALAERKVLLEKSIEKNI